MAACICRRPFRQPYICFSISFNLTLPFCNRISSIRFHNGCVQTAAVRFTSGVPESFCIFPCTCIQMSVSQPGRFPTYLIPHPMQNCQDIFPKILFSWRRNYCLLRKAVCFLGKIAVPFRPWRFCNYCSEQS